MLRLERGRESSDLILHIGAGKTGTSALQAQFAKNREILSKHGIHYPKADSDRQALKNLTTSGNGIELGMLLKSEDFTEKKAKALLSSYIAESERKTILLSSEHLEFYKKDLLFRLDQVAQQLGLRIKIVYYVRAIGDHIVSGYHQLLKRHLYTGSLSEIVNMYINQKMEYRFLRVIENSIEVFGRDSITVKNYDRVKDNIFADFLRNVLEIENLEEFKIEKKRINRSLTNYEIRLMRFMNRFFDKNIHSTFVSNALIHNYPNSNYRMMIQRSDADKIRKKYDKDTEKLNEYLAPEERPLHTIEDLVIVNEMKDADMNPFQEAVLAILAELVKEAKK